MGHEKPHHAAGCQFGPMRLRMFGTYCMRVINPVAFVKEIVGTDGTFTKEEITEQLRNIIVARFSDLVAESRIAALDLASNYDELGKFAPRSGSDDFEAYGLDVTNLLVENVSLPPEVEAALDKRTSMGVIGNLQQYAQFQAANAMEAAAKNPGGEAAGGMGLGMGFAMANQMANSFGQQTPQGAAAGPPPIPGQTSYFVAVNGQQTGPLAQDCSSSRPNRVRSRRRRSCGHKAWRAGSQPGRCRSWRGFSSRDRRLCRSDWEKAWVLWVV